jgi:plastocyanin
MRRLAFVVFVCVAFAGAALVGFALAGIAVAKRVQVTTDVTVHIREWSFNLSRETVPVGTVVFTVINDGPLEPHDFAVGGRASAVLRPGESTTLEVTFTQPGLYTYEDSIADTDREMTGTLTVTGTAVSTAPTTTKPVTTTIVDAPLPLAHVADVTLPGSATRLDYQSVDVARRRLFIAHLGAGRVLSFDLARRRVSGVIGGIAGAHGVLVVPSLARLYVAATGSRQLVTVDERTGRVIARAPAGTYPDGVAYDSRNRLVFVSDEAGDQVTVFARSGRRIGAVKLGGDAGNVQSDGPSGRILVDVGSQNSVAVIDPRKRKVVRTIALPGCDHAHGLHLDTAHRLAFVACDKNATLLVVGLRTMQVTDTESVGDRPDVLDFDAGLRRLYVASESGEVSVFAERGTTLQKLGQAKLADNAHSVAVDPRTHLVYFPLENVNGKPVLRIMRPT